MKANGTKYYVYGCNHLFDDIMKIVESAASAEWNNETPYNWLLRMEIDTSDMNISRTEAIRFYLSQTVEVYSDPDVRNLNDLPF